MQIACVPKPCYREVGTRPENRYHATAGTEALVTRLNWKISSVPTLINSVDFLAFCELGTTCHDFACICQCRYSKQYDWRFCYIVVLTGWEVSNRYVVKNSVGQQVFFAAEESDVCTRQCCGNARGFVMHITDNLGQVRLSYLLSVSPESGLLICGSINSKTKHFLAKQTPPPD